MPSRSRSRRCLLLLVVIEALAAWRVLNKLPKASHHFSIVGGHPSDDALGLAAVHRKAPSATSRTRWHSRSLHSGLRVLIVPSITTDGQMILVAAMNGADRDNRGRHFARDALWASLTKVADMGIASQLVGRRAMCHFAGDCDCELVGGFCDRALARGKLPSGTLWSDAETDGPVEGVQQLLVSHAAPPERFGPPRLA